MGKNLRNRCFQGNRTCTEGGACAGSQSRRQSGILGHRVPVAGEQFVRGSVWGGGQRVGRVLGGTGHDKDRVSQGRCVSVHMLLAPTLSGA